MEFNKHGKNKEKALAVLIGIVAFVFAAYVCDAFFDAFDLRSPIVIKLQSPITRRVYKEVILTPVITTPQPTKTPTVAPKKRVFAPNDMESAIIAQKQHAELISHIYKHESSYGRNDVCRSMGKYNGFGMGEWPGHRPNCYDSFESVVNEVNTWIEKHSGLSTDVMTCLYIRGVKSGNCESDYKFISNI